MIQFDEPCFNVYIAKVRDWGIAALERAAAGVAAKKAVHICYGYGVLNVKRWKSGNTDWSQYEHTFPLLANSSIDQVSVETAASGVDVGVIQALRGKDVLLGVVDVGSETVESPETVAERLRQALRYAVPSTFTPAPIAACSPFRARRPGASSVPSQPAPCSSTRRSR